MGTLTACKPPTATVVAKVTGVDPQEKEKAIIDVTTGPGWSVTCQVDPIPGVAASAIESCDTVVADAKGHATLRLDSTWVDGHHTVTVTATLKKSVATAKLACDKPFLSVDGSYLHVIGRSCRGNIVFAPEMGPKAYGECTIRAASSWHEPIATAKLPVSELVANGEGPLDTVPVEITLKDVPLLTAKLSVTRGQRRSALLDTITKGEPIAGEDATPPSRAVLILPEHASDAPRLVGDPHAMLGSIRYVAHVEVVPRKNTTTCKYKDQSTGREVSGYGFFEDGAVKVQERRTKKVVAQTVILAKGDPCDAQQTLNSNATEAKSSGAWYTEADLDAWLVKYLATAVPATR
jgi:hypothetical protein